MFKWRPLCLIRVLIWRSQYIYSFPAVCVLRPYVFLFFVVSFVCICLHAWMEGSWRSPRWRQGALIVLQIHHAIHIYMIAAPSAAIITRCSSICVSNYTSFSKFTQMTNNLEGGRRAWARAIIDLTTNLTLLMMKALTILSWPNDDAMIQEKP